jgi:16S rRNA (cytidine1402-2'-O)-methyltransferase
MDSSPTGTLFVVATPIGNMQDITFRAVECLKSVDIVACEDTRHTGLLFSRLGFKKKMISYNDINAQKKVSQLISLMIDCQNVALVSDAGTPGVSDPAYRLVKSAVEHNIPVIAIPGPSAVLCARVVSGFQIGRASGRERVSR